MLRGDQRACVRSVYLDIIRLQDWEPATGERDRGSAVEAHTWRRTSMMRSLGLLTLTVVFFLGATSAFANDANIVTDISGTGIAVAQQVSHPDEDPWAGWVNLTVTNTGSEAWGDFHFEIYDPIGGQNIANVEWQDGAGYEPYSTQSGLVWQIDNTSIGAKIDLEFYGDAVMPGETAEFHVYNVNPDMLSFFGVMLYPTPVPEPATALLLGLGVLVLRRSR